VRRRCCAILNRERPRHISPASAAAGSRASRPARSASTRVSFEPDPYRAVADFPRRDGGAVLSGTGTARPLAQVDVAGARADPIDPSRSIYLDQAALEIPVFALAVASRDALRMADVLETILHATRRSIAATVSKPPRQTPRRCARSAQQCDQSLSHLARYAKRQLDIQGSRRYHSTLPALQIPVESRG
jgi:hypothetical protein